VKQLRRLIWFIASRLFVAVLVLGILVTVFYFSMNAANIYVILKDGMARRAQVIMMDEDPAVLNGYFSDVYLQRDTLLTATLEHGSVYTNYYDITGINHSLQLESVWCWPWDDTARAVFVESIQGIDGRLKASVRLMAQEMGLTNAPPAWAKIRYEAVLTKDNNRWVIRNLTQNGVLE